MPWGYKIDDSCCNVIKLIICWFALQEYQFRGIQKSEWNNLFNFIQAKRLRIENVAEAEMGPSGAVRPALDIDLGEDIDTGMPQFYLVDTVLSVLCVQRSFANTFKCY